MNTKVAPVYASIFMGKLESQVHRRHRYDMDQRPWQDVFPKDVNNFRPTIKFTEEVPDDIHGLMTYAVTSTQIW